jgi:hypothetical protein
MTQAHDKMIIDEYDQFVVHLPAKATTTEFDMTVTAGSLDPRRSASYGRLSPGARTTADPRFGS